MPLLSLSTTRLNPQELRTPPSSPTKQSSSSPDRAKATTPSKSGDPKSPPTPHKIKLVDDSKKPGAASAALQKLKKISLSPKTRSSTTAAAQEDSQSDSAVAKGPKKK